MIGEGYTINIKIDGVITVSSDIFGQVAVICKVLLLQEVSFIKNSIYFLKDDLPP